MHARARASMRAPFPRPPSRRAALAPRVKSAQCNRERGHLAQGPAVVQGVDVPPVLAEHEHDAVRVLGVPQLEVLLGGHSHPPVEGEGERAQVRIPQRGRVAQHGQPGRGPGPGGLAGVADEGRGAVEGYGAGLGVGRRRGRAEGLLRLRAAVRARRKRRGDRARGPRRMADRHHGPGLPRERAGLAAHGAPRLGGEGGGERRPRAVLLRARPRGAAVVEGEGPGARARLQHCQDPDGPGQRVRALETVYRLGPGEGRGDGEGPGAGDRVRAEKELARVVLVQGEARGAPLPGPVPAEASEVEARVAGP
mmetsp:Transcript_4354/g.14515  ORF Transcript_4354/g.14515 Transcript_4354/m.14515 type:complete len:309 (+) Transcript_4354:359-1285(+)